MYEQEIKKPTPKLNDKYSSKEEKVKKTPPIPSKNLNE